MFNATHTPQQRLKVYREFRQNCPAQGDAVAEALGSVNILPRYLDFYTPESWPTVFEIIHDGMFCQSGITLIMAATLCYLNLTNQHSVKLMAVSNNINGNQGLIAMVQDSCYGFVPGKVVSQSWALDNCVILDAHIKAPDKLLH